MDIADQVSINKVIKNIFLKTQVRIALDEGRTISSGILNWDEEHLLIKPPKPEPKTSQRILIASQGKLFFLICEFLGKDDKGNELLRPIKISVKEEGNTSEKIQAIESQTIKDCVVTNVLAQNDITKFLNDDKIKEIVKNNSRRLSHLFTKYSIYLNERHDDRLRIMHNYDQAIFIPNKDDKLCVPAGFVPHYEYMRVTKADKKEDSIAEICVPIKYRQFSMVGYVQVQNSSRLDMNAFNLVGLVAASIKKDLADYSNFEESKELCPVYDISQTEISFFHSNNKYFSRIFSIGDIIIFDLMVNKTKKITLRAIIRQIKALDKGFKIYAQYHILTLQQLEMIEDYLDTREV